MHACMRRLKIKRKMQCTCTLNAPSKEKRKEGRKHNIRGNDKQGDKLGLPQRGVQFFDFAFVRLCPRWSAFARVFLRFGFLVREPEICICLRLRAFVCVCKDPLLLHYILRQPDKQGREEIERWIS